MKADSIKKRGRTVFVAAALALMSAQAQAAFDYNKILSPVSGVICGIYKIFWTLAASLAALVFLAAAVQWVASRDDPGKRKSALSIMIHAIIGLILTGLANTIVKNIGSISGC